MEDLWEWAVLNDHRAICRWIVPIAYFEDGLPSRKGLEPLFVKFAGKPSFADGMIFASVFNLALKSKFRETLSLLRKDTDIEALDVFGNKLLSTAAAVGDEKVFDMLLTQRANVNARDSTDWTALHWAIGEGQEAIVKLLLARNDVDVNIPDCSLRTPLSLAASRAKNHFVKLLLARADINVQAADSFGYTPIFGAIRSGNVDAVTLILDHAKEDLSMLWNSGSGESLLMHAARNGYLNVTQVLLERYPSTVNWKNEDRQTALAFAAWGGETDLVELLLSCDGIDVETRDNQGRTPAALARHRGHKDIVEILERYQWARRSTIQSIPDLLSPQLPAQARPGTTHSGSHESDADAILEEDTEFDSADGLGELDDRGLRYGF